MTTLLIGALSQAFGPACRPPDAPAREVDAAEERRAGIALYEAGRYAEAVAAYERALAVEDDPGTRTNLANALKKLGRIDEASRQYRLVLAANPRDGITWYNLGNLLRDSFHDARAAVEAYRSAVEAAPDLAEAHFALGVALMDLADYEAAVAAIQAALGLAPADATWRASAEQALDVARLRLAEQRGVLPPPRK